MSFQSALHNYFARLGRNYDPLVVQSSEEFKHMVTNLATQYELRVKTLLLPTGVTTSDPRLRNAKTVSSRTYYLPTGRLFEMPDLCFIADIDGDLVPPAAGCRVGEETRYQIISESRILESEAAARNCGKSSASFVVLGEDEVHPSVERGIRPKSLVGSRKS